MNRRILALLCALALGLAGCGKSTEQTPVIDETAQASAPTAEPRHIRQTISDQITLDAEILGPVSPRMATYRLIPLALEPDQLYSVFLPEGWSGITKVEDRDKSVYRDAEGRELLLSDYCQEISYTADPDALYSSGQEQEINSLLYYHSQEHPDAAPHDLSFMTAAEMEKKAKDIFKALGIPFEPHTEVFVTLSGQELLDFQQEMFLTEGYTEFGTPFTLTQAEDACYMEFSFTMDGIPVYGPGENSASYADGVTPPEMMTASLYLTSQGIRHFVMFFACTAEPAGEPEAVLTPQEIADRMQQKYDLEIFFGELTYDRMFLEYMPIAEGDGYVLKPYWCVDSEDVGQWFHAVTGKDLTYGG